MDELRFGDNDTLSALVASMVRAHWLFLLTDVDALYTANPQSDPTAKPIRVVNDMSELQVDTGDGGQSGTLHTAGLQLTATCVWMAGISP